MKVRKAFPPNIDIIRTVLPVPPTATFAYGDTIYNPSGREITKDVEHHEHIHSQRQGNDPDGWWALYLKDPQFRLEEEIIAYREQYKFAKENGLSGKVLEWLKYKLAESLSGEAYGNLISYGEAVSKIRRTQIHLAVK